MLEKKAKAAFDANWNAMLAAGQAQAAAEQRALALPARQQREYQDWLRTGKNPPRGMEDMTEAERRALYHATPEYQAYQARLALLARQQREYQDWLRTGKNPPRGTEDMTEAERLALYHATPEYQDYIAQLAAYKAQTEEVFADPPPPTIWDKIKKALWELA